MMVYVESYKFWSSKEVEGSILGITINDESHQSLGPLYEGR